jgi:hypothetical protein
MNHPLSIGIRGVPTRTPLSVLSAGQGKALAEKNRNNDLWGDLSFFLPYLETTALQR